jgi:hypothetical protein
MDLERIGDSVKHLIRGIVGATLFEFGDVPVADPGPRGQFMTAEPPAPLLGNACAQMAQVIAEFGWPDDWLHECHPMGEPRRSSPL